jgi:hypothetical protein
MSGHRGTGKRFVLLTLRYQKQLKSADPDLLKQQAVYVQGIAFDDLAMLLSSGFQANSTSRTQTELDPTVVLSVDNETSTQLVVNLQPVDNARAYEVQTSTGTGQWQHAGTYTYTRNLVVENLTPGTTYNIRARAVGGSTGYSTGSDPVSHMATRPVES